jgi:hypothetical protein
MYHMTHSDHQIVSNLRLQYGDALKEHNDADIAHAWREYSLSDDYDVRHDKPELFIEWVNMIKEQEAQ